MTTDWMLWAAVAAITVVTLAFVTAPLWRRPESLADAQDRETRVRVLRDRRAEIDEEERNGRLDPVAAEDARRELVDTLAIELVRSEAGSHVRSLERKRTMAIVVGIVASVISVAVYWHIGTPKARSELAAQTTDAHRGARQIAELVAKARAELSVRPNDGEAWVALAQVNAMRGDLSAATLAYERAIELLAPNARLLADFAEVIALSQERSFAGRPLRLLEQAIALDANDPKTNGLLGAALFQTGRIEEAIPHLEKVLAQMDADSDQARQIRRLIANVKASSGASAKADARDADRAQARIRATVELGDGSRYSGQLLYISVRAATGPRMPFAVRRIENPVFPLEITLDDQDLMTPDRPLPIDQALVLEARLSQSGRAIRQPGDVFGTSEPFTIPASPTTVTIDQLVQ